MYVGVRLAGTIQKYFWEQTGLTQPIRDLLEGPLIIPKGLSRQEELAALRGIQGVRRLVGIWDWAIDRAYDDPVELIADVAALGVKIGLLKKGVPLLTRLLKTAGTGLAVRAVADLPGLVEDLVGLVGADPTELADAARRFRERYERGFVGEPVADAAQGVLETAILGADFVASAIGLASTPTVPNAFALVPKALMFVHSALGTMGAILGIVEGVELPPRIDPLVELGFEEDFEKLSRGVRKSFTRSGYQAQIRFRGVPHRTPTQEERIQAIGDFSGRIGDVRDIQRLRREFPDLTEERILQHRITQNGGRSVLMGVGSLQALKGRKRATVVAGIRF